MFSLTTLAGGPNCQGVSTIEQRPQLLSQTAHACDSSQGNDPPPAWRRRECPCVGTRRRRTAVQGKDPLLLLECAAESRMTILRSGISGRPWMPIQQLLETEVISLTKKTLPNRGWQTPAAPGQEAFLTPYLTTVRTGTRGNSGFKSVKKYSIPSRKRRKALQINTKNLVSSVWDHGAERSNRSTRTKSPLKSIDFRGLLLILCLLRRRI